MTQALSFLLVVGALFGTATAQTEASTSSAEELIARALDFIAAQEAATLETQIELCQIPAPPFQEARRGRFVQDQFQKLGLKDVRIDSVGNVLAEFPGRGAGPTVVLSAHLDTVFPEGTDVRVTRQGPLLKGPGIGDDCRGLAVILGVARALVEVGVEPAGTIVLAATVGEEGEGNLRGVRHLFEHELRGRVDHFISVDGAGSEVTHVAVGSERYRVIFSGPGGHSWGAFGLPNPIHAAGRALARIADFEVPESPKVSFNVGLVEGGTSVNSIPYECHFSIDMRSADPQALQAISARFDEAVHEALAEENARWGGEVELSVRIETIGLRPAGIQPLDSHIVQTALESSRRVGLSPQPNAASTDSNYPISLGISAVTIDGGGTGRGSHSLNEVFDTTDSHKGTQWAFLLTYLLANAKKR